jgi:hypothetical protein
MQHDMISLFFGRPLLILLLLSAALPELRGAPADKPQGIPKETVRFEGAGFENVQLFASGNTLYMEVKNAAENSSLKIPRLANVVQSIRWQSAPEPIISLQPEPDHWIIRHGKPPVESGDVLIITFDAPPIVFEGSSVINAANDGLIFLPAKLATTAGQNLRYEPQPHKNTVGYWSNVNATAEWKLTASKEGAYEIDILQGCGTGHGGSTVEIQIGKESRSFVVEETGHFQNFIWRTVGTVELPAEEAITLKLAPKSKPGGAVMDVRAVRLSPPGAKRSFESELAAPDALPKKQ